MLSPFFLLFWALRSMTQFETDTGYVNEELQRAFQTRLLFLRWLPFSHLSAAFERGGSLLSCSGCEHSILALSPASSDATSASRWLWPRAFPSRAAQSPPNPLPRCSWPGEFAGDTVRSARTGAPSVLPPPGTRRRARHFHVEKCPLGQTQVQL